MVLDPVNILFHEENNEVRLLYAGIQGLMPVAKEFEGLVIDQVKKFLGSFLKYREKIFKSLPLQEQMANIKLRQGIQESKTFAALESVLRKEKEELPIRLERILKQKKQEAQQKQQKKKEESAGSGVQKKQPIKNNLSKADLIQIVNNYHKKRFRYLLILGITAIVIGLSSFYFFQEYLFSSSNTLEDENLKKGKELAAMQQFEEAVKYFNKINFNNLSKEDTQIILASYLSAKQPQKIIDLAPAFTKDIVDFYIKIDDLEAIKKLKPNHPIIQFEQAVINKDKKKIISLKDKVPLDERRKYIIAFAFMTENDFSRALAFAKEQKHQALEVILSHIQKSDYTSAYEQAKKQNSKYLMQIVKEKEVDYIQNSNLPENEKNEKIQAILKEIEELKKQSNSNSEKK